MKQLFIAIIAAVAVVVVQYHFGTFSGDSFRVNALSVVVPYIYILVCFFIYHAVHAAFVVHRELEYQGTTKSKIFITDGVPAKSVNRARLITHGTAAIFCLLLALLCWALWKIAPPLPLAKSVIQPPEETVFATVEMAIASMGSEPHYFSGFLHVDQLSSISCRMQPIDILAFLRIENTSDSPITVTAYTVETGDSKVGWRALERISLAYGRVILSPQKGGPPPHTGNVINFPAGNTNVYGVLFSAEKSDLKRSAIVGMNSLDAQLLASIPLSPHSPMRGWVALRGDWRGGWRITLVDDLNKPHQFVIPQMKQPLDSDVMARLLKIGNLIDLSNCENAAVKLQ